MEAKTSDTNDREELAALCQKVIDKIGDVLKGEECQIAAHQLVALKGDCQWCVNYMKGKV